MRAAKIGNTAIGRVSRRRLGGVVAHTAFKAPRNVMTRRQRVEWGMRYFRRGGSGSSGG